ncbi:hypothetical protein ACVWXM_001776 [Bradyrhizobium sp. GM7.3]
MTCASESTLHDWTVGERVVVCEAAGPRLSGKQGVVLRVRCYAQQASRVARRFQRADHVAHHLRGPGRAARSRLRMVLPTRGKSAGVAQSQRGSGNVRHSGGRRASRGPAAPPDGRAGVPSQAPWPGRCGGPAQLNLLLKESRSSCVIEGESRRRILSSGGIRSSAKQDGRRSMRRCSCACTALSSVDERFVKLGFRQEGGFIGEHDHETQRPIPDHISAPSRRYRLPRPRIDRVRPGLVN